MDWQAEYQILRNEVIRMIPKYYIDNTSIRPLVIDEVLDEEDYPHIYQLAEEESKRVKGQL